MANGTTILMVLLICLTAVIALLVLGFALWLGDRATKRWMAMFCEKLLIDPISTGVREAAQTVVPLVKTPVLKKRFSVPIPGAEQFRKEG